MGGPLFGRALFATLAGSAGTLVPLLMLGLVALDLPLALKLLAQSLCFGRPLLLGGHLPRSRRLRSSSTRRARSWAARLAASCCSRATRSRSRWRSCSACFRWRSCRSRSCRCCRSRSSRERRCSCSRRCLSASRLRAASSLLLLTPTPQWCWSYVNANIRITTIKNPITPIITFPFSCAPRPRAAERRPALRPRVGHAPFAGAPVLFLDRPTACVGRVARQDGVASPLPLATPTGLGAPAFAALAPLRPSGGLRVRPTSC